MARGFVRKNNLTKDTLYTIAKIGIIILASATSPYFLHHVVKTYFKDKAQKIIRARARKLRELEKRKLIKFEQLGGGGVRIELTHKGKIVIREYDLEKMQIKKPKKWDNQWRVIIYDIPVSQKKASNAFREKLRQLGLYQLQRSVWVYPYECLPEIEFLAIVFEININDCICYFYTKNIAREKEIKKHFEL